MGKRLLRLWALVLTLSGGLVQAFEPLNQTSAHKAYEDGDFDAVIDTLNAFQKAHPTHSRADSIFIAKHLAVVYAANPKTVEIGKHWMYRLLDLLPAADFAGMYVNEEIDRIFEKVRVEFLSRQHAFGMDTSKIVLPARTASQRVAAVDSGTGGKSTPVLMALANPSASAPVRNQDKLKASNKGRKKWLWLGVGGTAMVVMVTTYIVLSSDSDSGPTQTKVPVEL